MRIELEDACEIVVGGDGRAPVFLTCEHASERLPEPWEWPRDDRWLVGTHWAYDIGASDLTRELADGLGATAVLSRFSRLVVDPNRGEHEDDLFRTEAEGHTVAVNRDMDDAERTRRLDRLYRPYHDAIDRLVGQSAASVVLAVHTFTPVYAGEQRDVEVGVLFDGEEALAARVREALASTGLEARMNEPYSGRRGMMYSAERHGRTHGRRPIEIEVRQDLAVEATVRSRLVSVIGDVLGGVSRG